MLNRLNQILAVGLVIQIALAVWVFWPQTEAQAGGGPLIPDFAADEVVSLTIQDGDGSRLVLSKEGEEWVLPEAGNFPADATRITPILDKIAAIESNRLVTQTEGSQARLQVAPDEFSRLVEIEMAGGASHQLYIGSSAGAGATHVRLDEQPEVYLTGEVTSFDTNPQAANWIDTLYYTIPQTATIALTLENANGTFEFNREGDAWTMADLAEDETFNESTLTGMLNQVTSLRMTEPLGQEVEASFGLADPQATVTITTEVGNTSQTVVLEIGAQDENNNYIVKSSESDYYVKVGEFVGSTFVDKSRDDFLQQPVEEENPDPGSGSLEGTGEE